MIESYVGFDICVISGVSVTLIQDIVVPPALYQLKIPLPSV
jgi:hypothetical protein